MNSNVNKLNSIVYQFLKDEAPNYSLISSSNIVRDIVKNTVKKAKLGSEDLTQLQPISALGASITWDDADTDKFHLSYGNLRISEDSDTEDDKITYVFPDWPEATVEKLLPDDKYKEHNRYFGETVDADGDYIAVGQPGTTVGPHEGKVYVYYKPTWERAELVHNPISSYVERSVRYGYIVKIKGDYCAIISRGTSSIDPEYKDRLFIFKRTGINTWTEEFMHLLSDDRACDSVSIEGDYVFVSENNWSTGSKVLIFYRDPTSGWELDSEIVQPYPAVYGDGTSYVLISADGNYLAISFRNEDIGSYANAGAIYIYEKTGPNTWGNEYRIQSPNLRSDDTASHFGESMSMSGDYLGVKDYEDNFYIFRRTSGNIWDDVFKLPSLNYYYRNSSSIYIKGDTCIVSSALVNTEDIYYSGEAIIFKRTDINTWTEERKIWSPVPARISYFGRSAAIGNNFIIAGNPRDMDVGDIYHGSAWVFSY